MTERRASSVQPKRPSDPRVFFAAERTLLAWIRTGIAIIGLGFLVSRFGLFIRLLAAQTQSASHLDGGISHVLGIVFVMLGAVCMAVAAIQHSRFIATIEECDRPAAYSRSWAIWMSALLAIAGLGLAGYLAVAES